MRRPARLGRFGTGVVALVVVLGGATAGWFRLNPFADPYVISAEFEQASNLGARSPVRIAGIDVGKVVEVEPREGGGARVKMQLREEALPLHADAELKIRPRIFFEGNFFVDLRPGTPSAPPLADGSVIPASHTAAPVQTGDVLASLQADTRRDLQVLLGELGRGLGRGAAESLNRNAPYAAPALRDLALVADAALGERPSTDLRRALEGTRRTVAALAQDEAALEGLVTDLGVVAGALADEDAALAASIPELRDTLSAARPALGAVNATLPSLRTLALEARPGVEALVPAAAAVLPLAREVRGLVSPAELPAAARELRRGARPITRLLRVSVPLFAQGRAASRCTERVLVPFIESDFPDPDFPANTGTVNEKLQRSFIGLAGESRTVDANQSYFHASVVPPPLQVRPAPPNDPSIPPPHRPDVPCETQDPPNLEAPSANVSETGGLNPRATGSARSIGGPALAVRRRALLEAKPLVDEWFRRLALRRSRLLEKEGWR